MTLAYVGLGANIEPHRHLKLAFEELGQVPETRVVRTSSLYRSAPLGYLEQPDFLNAVAELDTGLNPEALLDHLQEIENRHGRERPFPNAPRTLDLDLLMHGDSVMQTPRLTLPHPRMHERAFVLEPLTEIAPAAVIPGRGPASALRIASADQKVERIH